MGNKNIYNRLNELLNEYNNSTSISLETATANYLRHAIVNVEKSTLVEYKYFFRLFESFINSSDILLNDINPRTVQEFLDDYAIGRSSYSVKNAQKCIKRLYNYYINIEEIYNNPVNKTVVKRPMENLPLFFSKDDFKKLIGVTDRDDFKDLILFDVNTGLREGEIINLKWDSIIADKLIVLTRWHKTKNGRIRSIKLNNIALEVINRRMELNQEYVFTFLNKRKWKKGRANKILKRYLKKVGLNDKLHFHSFRHTFASWLVISGVPLYNVSKLLGHSDIETTKIYAHLAEEDTDLNVLL